jgi:hypothetical protein
MSTGFEWHRLMMGWCRNGWCSRDGDSRTLLLRGFVAFVPADFRKTVVFIGQDIAGEAYVCGSAFWVINVPPSEELAKQYRPAYLVTAAHVIEGLRSKGVRTFRIRVNLKTGYAKWLDGMSIDRWKEHPDRTVDASFLKLAIYEEWDHAGWPTDAFVTPESLKHENTEIELGDEVFSVGLFWPHKGKTRNVPIVRIGNVAALRGEKVETKRGTLSDLYLMEARSLGGLSGSPVYMDVLHSITGKEGVTLLYPVKGTRFRLFGLISGHYTGIDDERQTSGISENDLAKLNMGIADVTPADKLLEGLHQFKVEEEEESKQYRERGPLSVEVGDTTPQTNVTSNLAKFGYSDAIGEGWPTKKRNK